jgi:hypothetical protein
MLPPKPPKQVLVKWIDHGSIGDGGWESVKKVQEEGPKFVDDPCWACGFLIQETKTCITVCSQLTGADADDENTKCSGDITIAKCAILSIKELK